MTDAPKAQWLRNGGVCALVFILSREELKQTRCRGGRSGQWPVDE